MRLKHSVLLIIWIFCACLTYPVFVSAAGYNMTGNADARFTGGRTIINEDNTNIGFATQGLSSGKYAPLLGDLDGDGIQEIVVLDGSTLNLYHGSSLQIVDGYTISSMSAESPPVLADIDGDGNVEILIAYVAGTAEKISVIKYNGTMMYNESDIVYATSFTSAGRKVLNCRGPNDCLLTFTDKSSGVAARGKVYSTFFNLTRAGTNVQIAQTHTNTLGSLCLPFINTMPVADYDNDGSKEYIYSLIDSGNVNVFDILIEYVAVSANGTVTAEQEIFDGTPAHSGTLDGNCGTADRLRFLSPPFVEDIDGKVSNGKETVVAFQVDADSYKIHSYLSTGAFYDDYPEILTGNGLLISNVAAIDVYQNGYNNFCAMGYNDASDDSEIVCASDGAFPNTVIFNYENPHAIPESGNPFFNMIHSIDAKTQTGTNYDEILSTFGIFEFSQDTSCLGIFDIGQYCAYEVYSISGNNSVVPMDAQAVGLDDLLVLRANSVYYIDDGYSNTPANISQYYVNPCLDAAWKLNTSVQVIVTPTDVDDVDLVNARVVLYADSIYENDLGWSANYSSGTPIRFDSQANVTVANGVLRMQARDTFNPAVVTTINVPMTVAQNGVEFGDCSTTKDLAAAISAAGTSDEALYNVTSLSPEDNVVTNSVRFLGNYTGLGALGTFLLLLFILNVWIFADKSKTLMQHPNDLRYLVIGLLAIDAFAIIIGALIGIIPFGIILTLIIFGIIAAGIWARNKFSSTGGF